MGKNAKGTAAGELLLLLVIILGVGVVFYVFNITPNLPPGKFLLTTVHIGGSTAPATIVPQSTLIAYALSLINKDRQQYGLGNVTLSGTTSAQQHSDSMLTYGYFSHWDTFGMKPYMRYTLVGGNGSVSENVAYRYSSECGLLGCSGNIDTENAIQDMEHSMIYNDSTCCNNGHRDNILDPNHNQISIGISYNSSTVYFAEDFIDNYINWVSGYPSFYSNTVALNGALQSDYTLSEVEVSYDAPVSNLTVAQLAQTHSYGYGTTVAGVASSSLYYYQGITTLVASKYDTSGSSFNIQFSIEKLIKQYGGGEYTVLVWLNGTKGGSFVGSSYTIFINSDGVQYTPINV